MAERITDRQVRRLLEVVIDANAGNPAPASRDDRGVIEYLKSDEAVEVMAVALALGNGYDEDDPANVPDDIVAHFTDFASELRDALLSAIRERGGEG